jgi:hypothetical protein
MKPQISKIKHELNRLQDFMNLCCDPRVRKVLNTIRDERAPRVAELQNQLAEARRNAPAKKPRWPDNVPGNVLAAFFESIAGMTSWSAPVIPPGDTQPMGAG